MLLPNERIRQGLLHPDQDVRDAVVHFFSRSNTRDPAAMPLAIQAIEQFGWQQAFSAYRFLPGLLQTESTLDWIIDRLTSPQPFSSKAEEQRCAYLRSSLVCSDPTLLRERRSALDSIASLDQDALDLIDKRIELAGLSSRDLWNRLESLCRNGDQETTDSPMLHVCDIVRALSRHADRREELVLAILSCDADDFWPRGLGVQLAGELRIEAAIPQLVAMLNDDDVWVFEKCGPALANIGTDEVVRRLSKQYSRRNRDYRDGARSVLGLIYSEHSVATRLELAHLATERGERGELLASTLKHFAVESIQPARRFILQAPLDYDGLIVRKCLLVACKLIGCGFTEFDAWREDSKNDGEYEQRWISERSEGLSFSGDNHARVSAILEEACRAAVR